MQPAQLSRGRSTVARDKSPPRAIADGVLPTPEQLAVRVAKWGDMLPRPASPGSITPQTVTAGNTPRGGRKKQRGDQRGPSPRPGKGNRASSSGQGRAQNVAHSPGYKQYVAATSGHGRRPHSQPPSRTTGYGRGAHSQPPSRTWVAAGDAAPSENLAAALVHRDPQPDLEVIISVVQGGALYIQIFTL